MSRLASPWRFAIAGPSGAGKSTLAHLLLTCSEGVTCVWEPNPPSGILQSKPDLAEATAFQLLITKSRQQQAREHQGARVLLFDRTFEEDREVFLPLYVALGLLTQVQSDSLARRSQEAESKVGVPHSGIYLKARPEVLTRRVFSDAHQERPIWLLENIEREFALYWEWEKRISGRFWIQDTSEFDENDLRRLAKEICETILT